MRTTKWRTLLASNCTGTYICSYYWQLLQVFVTKILRFGNWNIKIISLRSLFPKRYHRKKLLKENQPDWVDIFYPGTAKEPFCKLYVPYTIVFVWNMFHGGSLTIVACRWAPLGSKTSNSGKLGLTWLEKSGVWHFFGLLHFLLEF